MPTNQPRIQTIDLKFLGEVSAIAAFVIADDDGYTMVECGPHSTHQTLLAGLEAISIDPTEIHTLLLTHIHFDHAGSAWWWAQRNTHVYVHPRGLKHMVDPSRLYGSAARIYGDENMEKLWGKMEGIVPSSITAVEDRQEIRIGDNTWIAHHTPGHASHHIAWQLGDVVFTGDVGGVLIKGGPVVPPCPPPDIDVDAWQESIRRLKQLPVHTFYLTHYGPVPVEGHLDSLEQRLKAYVSWVDERLQQDPNPHNHVSDFTDMVETELRKEGATEAVIAAYRVANPPYMTVSGIARWLKSRNE